MPGISGEVLGCALLPVNFVIGFILAKYLSMRGKRGGYIVAYLFFFIVLQSLLYKVTAVHFWLGILFTFFGFRFLVPGLTGGPASGKTTVASYLKARGWDVIDADEIAKNVVKRGAPAYHQIVKKFGTSILDTSTGEIDRAHLRQVIFRDAPNRRLLNSLTHPWIIANIVWQLFKLRICLWRQRVILDVPLLFETHLNLFCGPVAVVYVADELQLSRLIERDRTCSEKTLRSMICSQRALKEKASLADIVLDNNSTLDNLFDQIKQHFRC